MPDESDCLFLDKYSSLLPLRMSSDWAWIWNEWQRSVLEWCHQLKGMGEMISCGKSHISKMWQRRMGPRLDYASCRTTLNLLAGQKKASFPFIFSFVGPYFSTFWLYFQFLQTARWGMIMRILFWAVHLSQCDAQDIVQFIHIKKCRIVIFSEQNIRRVLKASFTMSFWKTWCCKPP